MRTNDGHGWNFAQSCFLKNLDPTYRACHEELAELCEFPEFDLDDLTHDILILLRKIPDARIETNPEGYVFRAVKRFLRKRSKKLRRRKEQAERWKMQTQRENDLRTNLESSGPFGTTANNADAVKLLNKILETCSPEDRELLQLYLEEIPRAEIGTRLGISANAVAVRFHRLTQKLQRKYAKANPFTSKSSLPRKASTIDEKSSRLNEIGEQNV